MRLFLRLGFAFTQFSSILFELDLDYRKDLISYGKFDVKTVLFFFPVPCIEAFPFPPPHDLCGLNPHHSFGEAYLANMEFFYIIFSVHDLDENRSVARVQAGSGLMILPSHLEGGQNAAR